MSQVVISEIAHADILRLTTFLKENDSAKQAVEVMHLLNEAFISLLSLPNMGKIYQSKQKNPLLNNAREISLKYGKSGYKFLYNYQKDNNTVVILTVKHYRENRYRI